MSYVNLVRLPDGLSYFAPRDPTGNYFEIELTFEEVFRTDTYRNDVVTLPHDATVVDLGANIGLFTMLVKRSLPAATILAVEPMPTTFDALRRNVELHQLRGVTLCQAAVGAKDELDVEFTFYPLHPGSSTRFPEQTSLRTLGIPVRADVLPLSPLLSRHADWPAIDLVKVDIEGGEVDTLERLDSPDWMRINALVIEVRDIDDQLSRLSTLLERHGFHVLAAPASAALDEGTFIVHASKRKAH